MADPDVMDTWATSSLSPQVASGWDTDPELFAAGLPDGPAPAGARHHPDLAVLDRRPGALRARHGALDARHDLGLRRRPRPQEDVEVQGQRDDADRRPGALRHRRRPLAGRRGAARCGLAVRRGADEGRPAAGHQDPQRRQVRPPRRRALPAAVRDDGADAAVRRRGARGRAPPRRAGQGLGHRHDLHLRRPHRRHVVARAGAAHPRDHRLGRPAAARPPRRRWSRRATPSSRGRRRTRAGAGRGAAAGARGAGR